MMALWDTCSSYIISKVIWCGRTVLHASVRTIISEKKGHNRTVSHTFSRRYIFIIAIRTRGFANIIVSVKLGVFGTEHYAFVSCAIGIERWTTGRITWSGWILSKVTIWTLQYTSLIGLVGIIWFRAIDNTLACWFVSIKSMGRIGWAPSNASPRFILTKIWRRTVFNTSSIYCISIRFRVSSTRCFAFAVNFISKLTTCTSCYTHFSCILRIVSVWTLCCAHIIFWVGVIWTWTSTYNPWHLYTSMSRGIFMCLGWGCGTISHAYSIICLFVFPWSHSTLSNTNLNNCIRIFIGWTLAHTFSWTVLSVLILWTSCYTCSIIVFSERSPPSCSWMFPWTCCNTSSCMRISIVRSTGGAR